MAAEGGWLPGSGMAAEGGWPPGRCRKMPALPRMFRLQNIRSPKHSAPLLLQPDGQAVCSPSAKTRLCASRPVCVQNVKGF